MKRSLVAVGAALSIAAFPAGWVAISNPSVASAAVPADVTETETVTETATATEIATETATETATATVTAVQTQTSIQTQTATATSTATSLSTRTATAHSTATVRTRSTTVVVIPGAVTVRTFTPSAGPPILITTTAPPVTITPSAADILADVGQTPVARTSAPLYWVYALLVVCIFAMVSLAVYLVRR